MNLSALMKRLPRFLRRHRLVRLLLFLSPSSAIQEVEFNGGARLYADVSDEFTRAYFLTRTFEPEFFAVAAPFLAKGGVFFDVGANFGFCTFGLVHLLKDVPFDCHLFEANPAVWRVLTESTKRFCALHNIAIHHACVDERVGHSRFTILPHHLGASHVSAEGELSVPNLILDDYIQERHITRIDFMKMDIEGNELHALRGLKTSLKEKRIRALYIEVCCETLERRGSTAVDLLNVVTAHGYRIFYVQPADLQHESHPASIRVNGCAVRLKEVNNDFPKGHLTDLLALPRDSEFLQETAL